MLVQKEVSFVHGAVLTKDMLRELYLYPRNFVELTYDLYSDGILQGIDFVTQDGHVCLTRGIIKFQGEYYFLVRPLDLTAYLQGQNLKDKRYNLYLQKREKSYADHITEKSLSIYISENVEKDMFLLCRFGGTTVEMPVVLSQEDTQKYNKDSQFFEFCNNSYVDLKETIYASPQEGTFHPFLFRAIREYLQEKKDKTLMEWVLLLQLQNRPVLSMEAVKTYLHYAGDDDTITSRSELFCRFIRSIEKENYSIKKEDSVKPRHSFGGVK